jgi:hypothetical protein
VCVPRFTHSFMISLHLRLKVRPDCRQYVLAGLKALGPGAWMDGFRQWPGTVPTSLEEALALAMDESVPKW